jgi:ATP-dependent DNA helicase RecQ
VQDNTVEQLRSILRKYWGYDEFRPLQAEAMQSVVAGRDSVVVLPTGGGKSLCFQAPAVQLPGLAVVVSPLISLMKDQVDSLTDCGVPAACVNSTLSPLERRQVADDVRSGKLKLLYLSPEKLMTERTLDFLKSTQLSFFAIDEAHCISDWGHDFRPEYRMLRALKKTFPGVAVHAYTATATETVRHDIARELHLQDPNILVGPFDRPNLVYRVQRRTDLTRQIREVIDRHPGEGGIIYCIRRADVEQTADMLKGLGLKALPYHAGMDDTKRQRNQDAFINDRAKIIVATVAFGMGIDKSDVRYVIHAAAPKSLESYQQESGRAGRDGLEAECCMFYSTGDFQSWRRLQADLPPKAYEIAMQVLAGIEKFCTGVNCRHQAILNYFGQRLEEPRCNACDVCLAEVDLVEDPLVISQKILSCVIRLNQNFGGDYTALVLSGSREARILENGHDKLSTHGLLQEQGKKNVRDWIEQLVGQGYLDKVGEYSQLQITQCGREVLRGEITPRLLTPAVGGKKESKASKASWEGVDRGLFEALRVLRRQKAEEKGLPPFVVFSDATLRNLARYRPTTIDNMLHVNGIGEKKSAEYGEEFLQLIGDYCGENNLLTDVGNEAGSTTKTRKPRGERSGVVEVQLGGSAAKAKSMQLFAEGKTLDEVCEIVGRAKSTVGEYLVEHVLSEGICDPSHWIEPKSFSRIRTAVEKHGMEKLKPLHEELAGAVPYELIRVAVACIRNDMPAE